MHLYFFFQSNLGGLCKIPPIFLALLGLRLINLYIINCQDVGFSVEYVDPSGQKTVS